MDKTDHTLYACYGDATVPWVPLFGLGATPVNIGLTGDHTWVFRAADGRIHSIESQPFPALPILERPFHEARALIRRSLSERGFDESVEDSFPYKEALKCALTFTEYWVDKALDWIVEHAEFVDGLEPQLTRVRASQSQRNMHRAAALLRRPGDRKT